MRGTIITGLDIGSHNIHAVAVQKNDGELQKFQILGVASASTEGVRKGAVVNIEEAGRSIRACVAELEKNAGTKINRVALSLGGTYVGSRLSKGVVAVSRADQEISEEDVSRVIKAAEAISLPPNREIIHVIPREFIVDNEAGIRDPLGMHGVRLEVNALVIDGFTPFIKNLLKAVELAGLRHSALILSTLAAARAVLTKRQRELGAAVLDIGTTTSGLSVFEEDNLLHTQVLPIGSGHITNDLAIGLRTDIDIAERIKLEYGSVSELGITGKKEVINLEKLGLEKQSIAKKEVASIIEARLSELFDMVIKELKGIGRDGLLPAGVVIFGGGAKMPGILDLAKAKFRLPVHIGRVHEEFGGLIEKVKDPSFVSAFGLVLWMDDFAEKDLRVDKNYSVKFKKWLRAFLP